MLRQPLERIPTFSQDILTMLTVIIAVITIIDVIFYVVVIAIIAIIAVIIIPKVIFFTIIMIIIAINANPLREFPTPSLYQIFLPRFPGRILVIAMLFMIANL